MLKKKMFRKRLIKSLKIKKNLDNLNKMAATSKVKLTRWLRRCSTSKKLSKMMMKKKRTICWMARAANTSYKSMARERWRKPVTRQEAALRQNLLRLWTSTNRVTFHLMGVSLALKHLRNQISGVQLT